MFISPKCHTSFVAHPVAYSMGTNDDFPTGKAA
jgi:hypothetical protein